MEQASAAVAGKASDIDTGAHEYVDLGLPSGTLWATCNVGASNPDDYGDYFAWGENVPKSDYSWTTYKWCNGSLNYLTKYNNARKYGKVDNRIVLNLEDDAAVVNWGGLWRMPTFAEWAELREKCTWTWTSQNGHKGYKVVSKSNGNYIFLPAAGYRNGMSLYHEGMYGYYWCPSLTESGPYKAWILYFSSGFVYSDNSDRCYGRPVRPVCRP